MRSWYLNDTAKGAILGVIAFVLVSSALPIASVSAATGPLFSITLIAPTSNPQRRQWAAIIQNSFVSVNIDAKLVYMLFSQWINIFGGCPNGCPPKSFAQGGWDAGFIGYGGGTSLPDFGTQNVVNYRNEGPGDVPPIGGNAYFFKNATFNSLADDYNSNFNATQRLADAQKMVKIAYQERPSLVIEYPASITAYLSALKPWGTSGATAAITQGTAGLDWQHWATGSTTAINVATTGTLDAVNVLPTSAQNSFYDRYLYGPVIAGTQESDARGVGIYYKALANTITSSSDHKTWTETFKAHTFQDGVAVTADDYLFSVMAQLRGNDVQSVNTGTLQGLLGLNAEFHYLNGTVDYVKNGTYFHKTAPSGWTATSVWTSVAPASSNTLTFTIPTAYIFTDPILTGLGALPMHIYEKVLASTWSKSFLSGFTGSSGGLSTNRVTVTWDTTRYGGNGSYAWVYGPVGDGAYMYRGYDPVSQTGTLVKWSGYWNASGLASLNQFTATTIHITSVVTKDAAVAAFGNKQINYLDAQYTFTPADASTLTPLGANTVTVSDPGSGWQEVPINMNGPILGTGTSTPLGQTTPARAAFAARNVRQALSYLIPRQQIITNLLGGLAKPGITQFHPAYAVLTPGDIYKGISPDPYDPVQAQGFLAAAGYATGVAPPVPGQTVSLPTATVTVPGSTVQVPSFFLGSSFTLAGIYQPVRVSDMLKYQGFAVVLEQSTDSGTTWQPVSDTYTNTGGYFTLTYTPTLDGTVWYRLFFTGVPVSYLNGIGYGSPGSIEAVTPPTSNVKSQWQNVTATSYGATSKLTIGTFGDVVKLLASGAQLTAASSQLTTAINNLSNATTKSLNTLSTGQTSSNSAISAVQASVNTANTNIGNLQSSVSGLQNIAYAALAVAVVLGLLAIGLSLKKRS